jgi:hypothetical protein
MKKITIGLSTTPYLLSNIIRLLQGISISHSYLEFEDERYNKTMIYEAKGLNTNIINKNNFDKKTSIVYEFETLVSDELFDKIINHIYERAGTKYGWKEILGHGVKKVLSFIGININNPFPSKATICSESCGDILVLFFDVKADVRYSDMDLVWLLSKLKSHPLFLMTKGK